MSNTSSFLNIAGLHLTKQPKNCIGGIELATISILGHMFLCEGLTVTMQYGSVLLHCGQSSLV